MAINNQGGRTFTDFREWQKAHSLAVEIFRVTKAFDVEVRETLGNQLRDKVTEIEFLLAEFFVEEQPKVEHIHRCQILVVHIQDLLILAKDLKYIGQTLYDHLFMECIDLDKLLNQMYSRV